MTVESLAASLSRLVQVPSVNPGMSELAMVEEIERQLDRTGCTVTRVESMPGRPSLAAVLTGADGDGLVLNGHIDTVAVDDLARWTVDPFGGELRDGAIWGRGAVDMKGGLAIQIACARALSPFRDQLRGSLILHFAAGEECGEPGTLSLLENGFTGTWGITTEPTSLAVATAQRGMGWFRIRVEGQSAHAAAPTNDRNPISGAETVLQALRHYNDSLTTRQHPLLGHPICTVTMISAGVQHNAVPDTCELTVDRRLIPGETPATVEQELRALVVAAISEHPRLRAEVIPIHHAFQPAEVASDTPFVQLVHTTAAQVTGIARPICGTPYGSDVRNLINDAHMEAITFGPGDLSMCHCPDERQSIAEVRDAALVITRVATNLLLAA